MASLFITTTEPANGHGKPLVVGSLHDRKMKVLETRPYGTPDRLIEGVAELLAPAVLRDIDVETEITVDDLHPDFDHLAAIELLRAKGRA